MQHRETKQVRILLREGLTLKLRMNHAVNPSVELKSNAGSEKSWTWATTDFGLGEANEETFAIKFRSEELAREFKSKHDEARKLNGGESTDESSAESKVDSVAAGEEEAPESVAE